MQSAHPRRRVLEFLSNDWIRGPSRDPATFRLAHNSKAQCECNETLWTLSRRPRQSSTTNATKACGSLSNFTNSKLGSGSKIDHQNPPNHQPKREGEHRPENAADEALGPLTPLSIFQANFWHVCSQLWPKLGLLGLLTCATCQPPVNLSNPGFPSALWIKTRFFRNFLSSRASFRIFPPWA